MVQTCDNHMGGSVVCSVGVGIVMEQNDFPNGLVASFAPISGPKLLKKCAVVKSINFLYSCRKSNRRTHFESQKTVAKTLSSDARVLTFPGAVFPFFHHSISACLLWECSGRPKSHHVAEKGVPFSTVPFQMLLTDVEMKIFLFPRGKAWYPTSQHFWQLKLITNDGMDTPDTDLYFTWDFSDGEGMVILQKVTNCLNVSIS